MIDIHLIRNSPQFVRDALNKRGYGHGYDDLVTRLVCLDQQWRERLAKVEALRAQVNQASKRIGEIARSTKPGDKAERDELTVEVRAIKAKLTTETDYLKKEEVNNYWQMSMPNLPHESVHGGLTPVVMAEVGKPGEGVPPHWELLADYLDIEASAQIAGSGFYVMKGPLATAQRHLVRLMLDHHLREGYVEYALPHFAKYEALQGTGQLPKFGDDMYEVKANGMNLIPTGEVPLVNLYAGKIIDESELPLRLTTVTPCYRREAGSAGKDTRGLQRLHQFEKVEIVQICLAEKSYNQLEEMREHVASLIEQLGFPHYRTVLLGAEDMGFAAAKCYDFEIWAPGVGQYLEVSSCSNCESFQARRANIRIRRADGTLEFAHTLNASGLALPRVIASLAEVSYQQFGDPLAMMS